MVISEILFPGKKADRKALYLHGNGRVLGKGLEIPSNETVRFDTYFNSFFYTPFVRYTNLTSVSLHIEVSGELSVKLFHMKRNGEIDVISETRIVSDKGNISSRDILLPPLLSLPADGMIYPEITAFSNGAVIHNASYNTLVSFVNSIKLAIVICTFHREAYISRNLDLLRQQILDRNDPAAQAVDVLVVDNGKSLSIEETSRLRLFPNKNLGGSGGFTRGLIEAEREPDKYTHVLFMDDDISFEPESILRTVRFLQLLKEQTQPVCIGGHMLQEDLPCMQYEAGACFRKGYIFPNGRDLDLSTPSALLHNGEERPCDFNAWWYCCFPISAARKIGLPLPLFIRGDDLEYGLRMKPKVILVNGIGVWHMPFAKKESPHLQYYIKRNELLVSALYDTGYWKWIAFRKLIRAYGKALLLKDMKSFRFVIKGYKDFLCGSSFFYSCDEESLNRILIKEKEAVYTNQCYLFQLLFVIFAIIIRYNKTRKDLIENISITSSSQFWYSHLNIES